jgi:hypothetical protein
LILIYNYSSQKIQLTASSFPVLSQKLLGLWDFWYNWNHQVFDSDFSKPKNILKSKTGIYPQNQIPTQQMSKLQVFFGCFLNITNIPFYGLAHQI